MRDKLGIIIILVIVIIALPFFITLIINGGKNGRHNLLANIKSGKDVLICVNGSNKLIDVEQYIAGILPGLIDYKSDIKLIEAQAVALRGKILYEMGDDSVINEDELEFAYFYEQDLIDKFGANQVDEAMTKYEKAVYNTLGRTELSK